ncbi:hypothetical protein [Dactylosporangium sp. CA-233914]|uniref:hypothetical protein n=1 Tax=Dactylosporangium sp. CA-233914 TaxID=3239934 RepID=UPI003D8ACA93
MIDLDRYPEIDPARAPSGPALLRRRPGLRSAVVAVLALLATAPAAPPRTMTVARGTPVPASCTGDAQVVVTGDAYHILNAGSVVLTGRCP